MRRYIAKAPIHLMAIVTVFSILAVAAIVLLTNDGNFAALLPGAFFPFAIGATNEIQDRGNVINVVLTNPASGGLSGAPARVGTMTGVMVANQAADGSASLVVKGVYSLTVAGKDDSGNVAVATGDEVYYVDADTPKLSKKKSGAFFGYALGAVASGNTTTAINVALADRKSQGFPFNAGIEVATADTATITAAQVLSGMLRGIPTAGATYTLPTAALLVAAIPGAFIGQTILVTIENSSAGAFAITPAAGAGGTGRNLAAIPQNKGALLLFTLTNVTLASEAYTVHQITGA